MPETTGDDLSYFEALAEGLRSTWTPEGFWVWAALFCFFGFFLGSFLNVCIYRIPLGLSVNRPKRSFCYRCGSMIHWFDNIPMLSWMFLGGKCRACGSKISPRYAFVELATGILFGLIFLTSNTPAEPFHIATIWYCAFGALLVVGTFTDIDHWIIPDQVTLGGALAAVAAAIIIGAVDSAWMQNWSLLTVAGPFPMVIDVWGDSLYDIVTKFVLGPKEVGLEIGYTSWWWAPANAVLGAAFGSGLLYGIGIVGRMAFGKDAMGLGDVKLFAMIGATLGIAGSLITLILASFIGLIFGLTMIVMSRIGKFERGILQRGPDLLGPDPLSSDETPVIEAIVAAEEEAGEEHSAEPRLEGEKGAENPLERLLTISRNSPRSRPVHHLPFGPSIALGALAVLIFHCPIHKFIAELFALTVNC